MKKIILLLIILFLVGCSSYKLTYENKANGIKVYEKETGNHLIKIVYEREGIEPIISEYNQDKKYLISGTVFDFNWYEEDSMGVIMAPVTLILTPSLFEEGTLIDIEILKDNNIIAYSRNNLLHAPVESLMISFYSPEYGENPLTVLEVNEKGPFVYKVIAHDKNNNILGTREILFKMDQKQFLDSWAS